MKLLKEIVFFLPSLIWCWVAQIKNYLYDHLKVCRPFSPSHSKILSIGNLTMGGVGKTPLVLEFARRLSSTKRVGVIMKSYRGRLRHPARVQFKDPDSVSLYGDESVLVAQTLDPIPVFAGPKKWETVSHLSQIDPEAEFDVLIVDDGYQHRRLHRHCNLLILDATEPLSNYRCFPLGRGRENFSMGLKRADGIVVTRSNLVSMEELRHLISSLPAAIPRISLGLQVDEFYEWNSQSQSWQKRTLEEVRATSLALVSGLGRPEQLVKMLSTVGLEFQKQLHFRDHHSYQKQDFENLGLDILTTEKDAVKICRIADLKSRVFIVRAKLLWPEGSESFFQEVEKCLQS